VDNAVKVFGKNTTRNQIIINNEKFTIEGGDFFQNPKGLTFIALCGGQRSQLICFPFLFFYFWNISLFLGQSDVGGGNCECVRQEKIMKGHYGNNALW